MNIRQSFVMAIRNLLVNKMRSVQSMLCMVVSAAGVVIVLVLGITILNLFDIVFDVYPPGSLTCFIEQNAAYTKAVTEADMEQLAADNPEIITLVSPLIWSSNMNISLRNEDRVYKDANIYGVNESYMGSYKGLQIQEGRFLQSMDISREQKVCVLGKNIADALFDGDALGKELKIWSGNYRVVGVMSDTLLANNELLIPYTTARKEIFGEDIRSYDANKFYHDQYDVVANGAENMLAAKQLIEDMLQEKTGKTGGGTGSVWNYGTRWTLSTYGVGSAKETMQGALFYYFYSWFLAICLVLLIGCVSIMNAMLASVQERTLEIGIRRAFGATNQDIKRQFTLEAVAVSLLGGALGVTLGLGALVIMAMTEVVIPVADGYQVCLDDMNGLTFVIPIVVVVTICIGVGVLSAAYPAQQAAKLEIVEALNEG